MESACSATLCRLWLNSASNCSDSRTCNSNSRALISTTFRQSKIHFKFNYFGTTALILPDHAFTKPLVVYWRHYFLNELLYVAEVVIIVIKLKEASPNTITGVWFYKYNSFLADFVNTDLFLQTLHKVVDKDSYGPIKFQMLHRATFLQNLHRIFGILDITLHFPQLCLPCSVDLCQGI